MRGSRCIYRGRSNPIYIDPTMKSIFEQELLTLKNSSYVNQETIDQFLTFIHSGQPLVKTENPAHHVCSFFLPVHRESKSVYLGHHKKANSWIPPGGHIESGESSLDAAKREFTEELGIPFTTQPIKLFDLSVIHIDRPEAHCKTHYDYWYAIFTDKINFQYDKEEFYDAGWFPIYKAVKKVTNMVYKPIFTKMQSSWIMLES